MENLKLVGEFQTKGELLVTDPCYDIGTWCSGKITVKAGKYKAYVKKGVVDNWGDRVHALYIVHENENLKDLTFTKTNIDVGVDSGQAGFFNADLYQQDLPEEVPLIGEEQYERRNHVHRIERFDEDGLSLASFKKIISEKVSKEELNKILEEQKADKEERLQEAKLACDNIDPNDCEKSKEFYKVCCSMTLGDLSAGVEKFGVVSSSGFGDGGYNCFVSQKDGDIVASYIEFINEDEEECEECGCMMDECGCDEQDSKEE